MANNEIKTRIKQRYDSLANWQSKNPILLEGEVARVKFADGTVRTKTGNGTAIKFNDLAWDDKNLYIANTSQPIPPKDSDIEWGGKNHYNSFGPIDAALISRLGANRFAFLPASVINVEYSRDNGTTWIDYEATDAQKIHLFSGLNSNLIIGKRASGNPSTVDDLLRVTITQANSNLYNEFRKFVFYVATMGSKNSWVTIEGLLHQNLSDETAYQTIVNKVSLEGWSGYNVLNNLSNSVVFGYNNGQFSKLRFIFGNDARNENHPTGSGLKILNIFGFGGVGWQTPSNMAKNDHIYAWDFTQNAAFPNQVRTSAVPQVDNDLTNKKYVDGKVSALTNPYELIETITLTEATEIIERNSEPDGTAYSFAKVLITVDTPKTDTVAQQNIRLYINDGTLDYYAYYQSLTTYAKRAHFDCAVENGLLKIRIGNGATNYGGENTSVAAMIENANIVFLSAINKIKLKGEATFAVGTIIKIYGVRA